MAPNDMDFDFPMEAQRAFSFMDAYGFSCVSISSSKVRYKSAVVGIDICYGESDGEVSISFGRIAKQEAFSFTLFLRLVDPQFEKDLGERLAASQAQLRECREKVAWALNRKGRSILQGD